MQVQTVFGFRSGQKEVPVEGRRGIIEYSSPMKVGGLMYKPNVKLGASTAKLIGHMVTLLGPPTCYGNAIRAKWGSETGTHARLDTRAHGE